MNLNIFHVIKSKPSDRDSNKDLRIWSNPFWYIENKHEGYCHEHNCECMDKYLLEYQYKYMKIRIETSKSNRYTSVREVAHGPLA